MKKIRSRKDDMHFIDMVGLASDCIGNVTLDGKYALVQIHPTYSIAVEPISGVDYPEFEKIVFYANCLAYEHDLPTLISPVKKRALIKPIEKGRNKYINDSYFDSIGMACEAIKAIRLGPLGLVYFRWSDFTKKVDLEYTNTYSSAAKELSLYSAAIRQLDPLSEFLGYYRVIESVSGKNHKIWISSNLSKLKSYNFGFLTFIVDVSDKPMKRRSNLFSIYRKRAVLRTRELNSKLKGRSISEYFWHENRCGIAHGKSNVKEYDFKYNIIEVSRDNYILKLLARIAIEEKI